MDKARLQAYSAPGAGRWQGAVPSKTLDKHLATKQLEIVTAVRLGVDVFEESFLCGLCGMCADTKGIHCMSCTGGGDSITRHNDARDIIYHFAKRASLRPQLEKAGLLQEPGIFLELRRPADVLVEGLASAGPGSAPMRVALDIKVINALGQDHIDDTMNDPLKAAEAYREKALLHNRTAERCQAQDIRYEPVVFTCQGGVEGHAESILSLVAQAVAKAEEVEAAVIKADMLERLSICLARHVARAIIRRTPWQVQAVPHPLQRCMREVGEAYEATASESVCMPAAAHDIRLRAGANAGEDRRCADCGLASCASCMPAAAVDAEGDTRMADA